MARQSWNWLAASVAVMLVAGSVYCFSTRECGSGSSGEVQAAPGASGDPAIGERGESVRGRSAAESELREQGALRQTELLQGDAEIATADRIFREFLARGPMERGAWKVKRLDQERTVYVAPHPTDAHKILLLGCASCTPNPGEPCAYPRRAAVRLFFEAPSKLFGGCYGLSRAEVHETADARAFELEYRPFFITGKKTRRTVTVDLEKKRVVAIRDQSRDGYLLRSIEYLGASTGEWDPTSFDPNDQNHCKKKACGRACDPVSSQIEKVRANSEFPLLLPDFVPSGFKLIRAFYHEGAVTKGSADPDAQGVPVRLNILLYSDGMALISVAIAPRADMDLLEMDLSAMGPGAAIEGGCPQAALPKGERQVNAEGGRVIRVRSGECRTVFRRDGVRTGNREESLSVTLLCRNELPADAYLRMIASVAPAPETVPAAYDDGEGGGDAHEGTADSEGAQADGAAEESGAGKAKGR